jgi:hypothetical protein
MKVFGPADQPFMTEDSILAFALYAAFTQFYDDEQPCVNFYTNDQLRALGYNGVMPSDAALMATDAGRKGTVNYIFRQPNPQMIAAFNDQKKVIADSEGLAKDVIKNLMTDFAAGARGLEETIVRLVVTIRYMGVEFTRLYQQLEPLIQIDTDTETTEDIQPDGSRVVTSNGFKFIGARASQKTREHMELC